jgi:hypothetical protein
MMANEKRTKQLGGTQRTEMAMNPMLFRPLIWCSVCARLVRMVTLEAATRISRADVKQLDRRMENHNLHSMRTQSGSVLICLSSLTEKA